MWATVLKKPGAELLPRGGEEKEGEKGAGGDSATDIMCIEGYPDVSPSAER